MAVLMGSTSTAGGSNDNFITGEASITRVQCVTSGSVDTIAMYWRNSANYTTPVYGIWADSAGSPSTLLGQTVGIVTSPGDGVKSAAISGSPVAVTSGTFYWLGFLWLSTGPNSNNTVIPGLGYRAETGLAALPNPWNPAGDSTNTAGHPIQAEGTASGAGSNLPISTGLRAVRGLVIR